MIKYNLFNGILAYFNKFISVIRLADEYSNFLTDKDFHDRLTDGVKTEKELKTVKPIILDFFRFIGSVQKANRTVLHLCNKYIILVSNHSN